MPGRAHQIRSQQICSSGAPTPDAARGCPAASAAGSAGRPRCAGACATAPAAPRCGLQCGIRQTVSHLIERSVINCRSRTKLSWGHASGGAGIGHILNERCRAAVPASAASCQRAHAALFFAASLGTAMQVARQGSAHSSPNACWTLRKLICCCHRCRDLPQRGHAAAPTSGHLVEQSGSCLILRHLAQH